MSIAIEPGKGFVNQIGEMVFDFLVGWGDVASFFGRTLRWTFRGRPRGGVLLPICYQVGVRSVPVVAITGLFIGMVLAIQMHTEFLRFPSAKGWMGVAINASVIRELGPVLAATMLAGRVGSAIAAELGTMRVTEQIDALWCLGANPIKHLVVPRFLACVFLIPLLTIFADFVGVMGGALLSIHYFGIESNQYWSLSQQKLGQWDIFTGLFKSMVFGSAIAIISCHRGFNSQGGAEGVGKAATEAFVASFVAILVLDFMLAMLFNTLYQKLWPY